MAEEIGVSGENLVSYASEVSLSYTDLSNQDRTYRKTKTLIHKPFGTKTPVKVNWGRD